MKVSICIPTWEMYGKGLSYLNKLFETILFQTYDNYEVIVSDHSQNDEIKLLCDSYSSKFEIKYLRNFSDVGNSPSNTNNSITNANGEIIKIMFQDDFFYNENSLKLITEKFKHTMCNWLVTGCNHTYNDGKTFENFMIPKWNDKILFGINTISSPSVLSFRNEGLVFFDKNLVMLMDCEMYYQLFKKYGLPTVIEKCLVTNRMHANQISALHSQNIDSEINYVKIKYNDNI